MRNRFLILSALLGLSTSAMAVPIDFQVGYTIDANDFDPGLVIQTSGLASSPFAFTLDIDGDRSYTTDLFYIWTDEHSVNPDDLAAQQISVAFNFSSPDGGNVTATGTTSGDVDQETVCIVFCFTVDFEAGQLRWDQASWTYGFGNGGLLQVSLFDTDFNAGIGDLFSGSWFGARVGAQFDLVSAPVDVPEPGTLMLLGIGLLGTGLASRRRKVA